MNFYVQGSLRSLSTISVRQSLSAFCASSLQYVSAIGGLHSFSEAVLLLTLKLLRLVCSDHFGTSLKCDYRKRCALSGNTPIHNDNIL